MQNLSSKKCSRVSFDVSKHFVLFKQNREQPRHTVCKATADSGLHFSIPKHGALFDLLFWDVGFLHNYHYQCRLHWNRINDSNKDILKSGSLAHCQHVNINICLNIRSFFPFREKKGGKTHTHTHNCFYYLLVCCRIILWVRLRSIG